MRRFGVSAGWMAPKFAVIAVFDIESQKTLHRVIFKSLWRQYHLCHHFSVRSSRNTAARWILARTITLVALNRAEITLVIVERRAGFEIKPVAHDDFRTSLLNVGFDWRQLLRIVRILLDMSISLILFLVVGIRVESLLVCKSKRFLICKEINRTTRCFTYWWL